MFHPGHYKHSGEASLRKHLREHDKKAALQREMRSIKKPRNSKNFATSKIRICDLEIKRLTPSPLSHGMLIRMSQTLVTKKAENKCYASSNATVKFPIIEYF